VIDTLFQFISPVPPLLFRYSHLAIHHRFTNRPPDWTSPFAYHGASFPMRPVSLSRYIFTFTARIWIRGLAAVVAGVFQRGALIKSLISWSIFAGLSAKLGQRDTARYVLFVLLPWLTMWFGAPYANYLHHSNVSYETPLHDANNNRRWSSLLLGFNIGLHVAHHIYPFSHWTDLTSLDKMLYRDTEH
jgi:fatty acid desaturase